MRGGHTRGGAAGTAGAGFWPVWLAVALLLGTVDSATAAGPASSPSDSSGAPLVHQMRIEGAIGPIVADYLRKELLRAQRANAELLIVELDTPGGLDTSMRQMVQGILSSTVPVATFVTPDGARAASAGVFVLMASHIAAMSPATNVGAAHPVNMGGQMDETMAKKVTNDAVAYLQSLAKQRGRNIAWCEQVVRESVSVPAEEALKLNVIDIVARDTADLLAQCDGRSVGSGPAARTLHTVGARVIRYPLDWRGRFLHRITDPTIAYILLLLGFYGLFFELSNPGSVVPGVIGAIGLLLAFLAFQSLPVNYVGVLLIVSGLIMLLLEIKITSYGTLTVGGIIALVLGSLLLFDPGNPFGSVPLQVILPAVLFSVLFFLLIVGMGLAAQRRRHATGLEAMIGQVGQIVRSTEPVEGGHSGRVLVAGELWQCLCQQPLASGQKVIITGCDGRVLQVESLVNAGMPTGEEPSGN